MTSSPARHGPHFTEGIYVGYRSAKGGHPSPIPLWARPELYTLCAGGAGAAHGGRWRRSHMHGAQYRRTGACAFCKPTCRPGGGARRHTVRQKALCAFLGGICPGGGAALRCSTAGGFPLLARRGGLARFPSRARSCWAFPARNCPSIRFIEFLPGPGGGGKGRAGKPHQIKRRRNEKVQ